MYLANNHDNHTKVLDTHLEPPEGVVALCALPGEEPGGLGGGVEHVLGGQALRLAHVADLVVLRRPGVERPAQEELGDHTAQRPHVDGLTERQA